MGYGYLNTIVGTTSRSRLNELRKSSASTVFINQYFGNGSFSNDGVDFVNSIPNQMVIYYIGGIKYTDYYTQYYPYPSYDTIPIGLENLF